MASSSAFASIRPRLFVDCGTHQTDLSSRRSDTVGFARDSPRKLPPLAPIKAFSNPPSDRGEELQSGPGDGAGLFGVVIAATAMAGLSLVSAASVAMASDLNNSLSTSSPLLPPREPTLSMALPVPHQEVWVFSQNGFLAPLPRTPSDGFIVPYPRPGKDVAYQDSDIRCPRWRPSEFEMVLPDFQGRPKPFRHQWPATFVVKGMDKTFLQAAFLEDGLAFAESEAGAGLIETSDEAVAKEMGQEEREGKISPPKALARVSLGKRFMCFSL